MSTQVLMPQMGESIAEGTIVTWLKKLGEKVGKDEPLYRIHATSQTGLGFACELAAESSGYAVTA